MITSGTLPAIQTAEVDRQEYRGNNCIFSSGLVHGVEPDVIYLRWEKEGEKQTMLLLRPDEAMRIAALLANAVWSHQMIAIDAQWQTC